MNSTTNIDQLSGAKGSKCVFLNTRSIVANINMLCADFEYKNISCVAITESWLTDRIPDVAGTINLSAYTFIIHIGKGDGNSSK